MLNITAGDEVDIQAWARYDFTAWDNSSVANIASIVSSAFGGASAGTGGESASTALSNALLIQWHLDCLQAIPAESRKPTCNTCSLMRTITMLPWFRLCSRRSRCRSAFAKLETGTLTYNEPGYLFIYVGERKQPECGRLLRRLKDHT